MVVFKLIMKETLKISYNDKFSGSPFISVLFPARPDIAKLSSDQNNWRFPEDTD